MATKYNPYNDYKKIVGYKGNWHNSQSIGEDPSQYYQAAMPYYQSLVDNGYQDLADDLSNSNYTQARGLWQKYGLKPDNEYFLDNDFNALTGNSGTSAIPSLKDSAADIINGSYKNDSYIDKLMDMGTGNSGMAQDAYNTARGIATGEIPITPSAATQNLFDAYERDYNRLNGEIQYDREGNVVSGLNTSHYNTGRNQLDYYNNFDITKQPYYEGIMAAYNLGGQNAANNAYSEGASTNSGNIDSYAAANANRQQLAFTTAGQQAALAVAQQNAANWNNLYAQMSDDLYKQGALSMQTLGIARDMYASDAQERMNALDTTGALASVQMENAIRGVESLIQERMADKNISAQMAMQEADIAAAIEQLEMQLLSNERIQEGVNETNRYVSDNSLAGTKYNADTNLAGVRDTNAANRDIAGITASANRDVANINANASLGVAGINADTSRYTAGLNADLNRYLGELGYNQALAGYQNALDVAGMNNANALEIARMSNDSALQQMAIEQQYKNDYLKELAKYGYTLDSKENVVSGTSPEGGMVSASVDDYIDMFYDAAQAGTLQWAQNLAQIGAQNITDSGTLIRYLTANGVPRDDANKISKELQSMDKNIFAKLANVTNPAATNNNTTNNTPNKKSTTYAS